MTEKQKIEFVEVEIEHYLDLKRKEQECEKLKIKLLQQNEINTFFNTPIPGWNNDPCGICECKHEYPKYKQALDEIEELVKRTNGACFYDDINDCENCDMNFGCSSFNLRKIKRIINKAKEN